MLGGDEVLGAGSVDQGVGELACVQGDGGAFSGVVFGGANDERGFGLEAE